MRTLQTAPARRPQLPPSRLAALGMPAVLVGVPVVAAVVAVVRLGAAPYRAIADDYPGLTTSLVSALGRSTVLLASLLAVGALVCALLLVPRRGRHRMQLAEFGLLSVVRTAGLVWLLAAAALVLIDAADVNGQPLTRLLEPRGLTLVEGAYLPRAWIVTGVCAALVLGTATLSRRWPALAATLPAAAVGVLAPLMVEHVLVGPNHDFAGDATILLVPAATAWLGATAVLILFPGHVSVDEGEGGPSAAGEPASRAVLTRRYRRLSLVCWPVVTIGQVVVLLVETQGSSTFGTATGQAFGVQLLVLAVLGGLLLAGRRTPAERGPFPGWRAGVALAGVAAYLAADVVRTRMPSPQYFVPTSIAQNYLGYDVPAPPSPATLAWDWRLNILFAVMAAAAVAAYLVGVRLLHRRGDRWPVGRTVAWLAGWLVVVVTTSSGVGRYSGASFSVHMALHMSLNMFAPALLVLGGPITLLLRASASHRRGRPAGVHEWVNALLGWRLTRSLYNPLHALFSYTASYYVLYFSDVFNQASRYHWAHEAMNLEFLFVGYLFFSLVIGVDTPPRPLPHLAKLGLVLAAMPFHAFFGVAVMMGDTVIAGQFYSYLASGVPWITDLHHDQYVGGGIAWAAGEVPLLFVMVALLVQWAKQDSRQARRTDRHLDSGLDESFEAYNAMLAKLGARDAALEAGPTRAGDDTPGAR